MNPIKRTAHYTIINVAYFAAYSGVHAYTAVFLLERGFSNTLIGVIIALANIFSVLLQPLAAGWIDKYERITNRKVSIVCAIGCVISCVLLYFIQNMAAIFVIYAILYMLQMIYQPLIQAMNFEYIAAGDKINFGLARGLGSCGFAVTSAIIGKLLLVNDVSILQIVNVVAFLMGILAMATFIKPSGIVEAEEKETALTESEEVSEGHNSFISFTKYYKMFMLFVLGGTCLFFAHNALNDYLFQIIEPIGGDKSVMGTMVMVAALLELPAMASFAAVEKKVGCKAILMLSGVMFTVKTVLMLLAPNLVVAYISQACQIFAYALFIPGGAYLAEKAMEQTDKTKGQAYVNCAITLGGVFSALVCGRLLDVLGVKAMLSVSTVIGAIGTVLVIIALKNLKFSVKETA